jgi:hypothetical protein
MSNVIRGRYRLRMKQRLAGGATGIGVSVKVTGRTVSAWRRARASHHWGVETGRPACSQKARCVRPLTRWCARVSGGDSGRRRRRAGTGTRAAGAVADTSASLPVSVGPHQMRLACRLRTSASCPSSSLRTNAGRSILAVAIDVAKVVLDEFAGSPSNRTTGRTGSRRRLCTKSYSALLAPLYPAGFIRRRISTDSNADAAASSSTTAVRKNSAFDGRSTRRSARSWASSRCVTFVSRSTRRTLATDTLAGGAARVADDPRRGAPRSGAAGAC